MTRKRCSGTATCRDLVAVSAFLTLVEIAIREIDQLRPDDRSASRILREIERHLPRLLEDGILDDADKDYLETLHRSFVRVVSDVKTGLHRGWWCWRDSCGAKFWFHGLRNCFITVAERELILHPSFTKRLVNHARPNDVTEGYAADWTVEQLRQPAQRTADRIETLMSAA